MINDDKEYEKTTDQIKAQKKRMLAEEQRLTSEGLTPSEIKHAVDPVRSFHMQLEEEVDSFQKQPK